MASASPSRDVKSLSSSSSSPLPFASSPQRLLEELYLTASVHGDALEASLFAMQRAVDQSQQEEARLRQMESDVAAALESLDRVTAMAGALVGASGAGGARRPVGAAGVGANSLDPLAFAKIANTFAVGDEQSPFAYPNPMGAEEGDNGASSSPRHRQAGASVAAATARLAALRHRLAAAEHSSVRRRLMRVEGLKHRINKGLAELTALCHIIDTTDARRGAAALLDATYPPSGVISLACRSCGHDGDPAVALPSSSTDDGEAAGSGAMMPLLSGGEAMDCLMRSALRRVHRSVAGAIATVDELLCTAEGRGGDRGEGSCFEEEDTDGILSRVLGGPPSQMLREGVSEDGSFGGGGGGALSAAFNAVLLSSALPHAIDTEWLGGLGRAVGGSEGEGSGSDAIADHYAHLTACWEGTQQAAMGDRASVAPHPTISLAASPSFPLPPHWPLMAILDPSSAAHVLPQPPSPSHHRDPSSPICDIGCPQPQQVHTPTPTLPPKGHILHRRFTYRGSSELKALESARVAMVRSCAGRLGDAAARGWAAVAMGGGAGGDAAIADALRAEASRGKGFRTWPAVHRPLPALSEGSDSANDGSEA